MAVLHTSFESSDSDAVEDRLRAHYGTVRLPDADIAMAETVVATPRFFLSRMAFTGSFAVTAEVPTITVMVSDGAHRWEAADEQGDGSTQPFMIRPDLRSTAYCGTSTVLAVTFLPGQLEAMARAFYADDDLRVDFASSAPLTPSLGAHFKAVLAYSAASMPIIFESEILQVAIARQLAAAVLECFPLGGDPTFRRDSVRSQQSGYRRGRGFIDDNAGLPITVADVAAAASLSVAAMNAAFRANAPTGTDAAGELIRVRLAHAHDDLLASDATAGDTVRDVALRWGFSPSGFSRKYAAAYGHHPGETLRR
jgi:AraC-like DNA-binding protein